MVKLFQQVNRREHYILSVASVALAWNSTVLCKLLCIDFIQREPVSKLNLSEHEVQVLHSETASLNKTFSGWSVKCSGRESGVPLSVIVGDTY